MRENTKQCKSLSLWHWIVVGGAYLGILRLRFPHKHPYTTDTSSEIFSSLLPAQPTANHMLRILMQIHKTPQPWINEKWLYLFIYSHSLIHLFYKYWLSTHYVPDTSPDGRWTAVNIRGAVICTKALNLESIWSVWDKAMIILFLSSFLKIFFYFFFKKYFIYLFLERGERREKERERNIKVWLSLTWPPLGTWPKTQVCVLPGNWTSDPLVHSLRSTHWAIPARESSWVLFSVPSLLNEYLLNEFLST